MQLAGRRYLLLLIAALGWLAPPGALAQDAAAGARLYLRTAQESRSCLACHGPDPGSNPNNILRAAGNPDALLKALNTVSAMGFLRPQLTDTDRADLAAFLANVVAERNAAAPQLWPRTVEFGAAAPGSEPLQQRVWLRNPGTAPVTLRPPKVAGDALTVAHDCPATLPAGAGCELRLAMGAGRTGWSRAALIVELDGGLQPLIGGTAVQGSDAPTSRLAWADTPSDRVDFSGVTPGPDGRVRRSLRLVNPGPAPAVLAAATIVGPRAPQFELEQRCAGTSVLQAGASCELVVAYTPGNLALAEAALQLRADQGHPPVLRLMGGAATTPSPTEAAPAVPEGGGGCSVRPPGGRFDPLLALLALAAAMALSRRRRGGPT